MISKFTIAAIVFGVIFVPYVSGDVVMSNDFEGGLAATGSGSFNGSQQFIGGAPGSFTGDLSFSSATFTAAGGLGGSATAGNFAVGTGSTYDGMWDIGVAELAAAGFIFNDPSLTTTVTYDFEVGASTVTNSYNGIVGIANTDGTDGNTFGQGANGHYFPSGASSGTATIDVTDLLALLDPAVNPSYTNLRLQSNKDTDSVLNITIDNIVVTQVQAVPEPSSAALALFGLVGLGIRRRRA